MAGLFGRFKTRAPARGEPAANEDPSDAGLDAVLDTLAAVLRLYGRGASDTERMGAASVRHVCEDWARHALVGGPSPSVGPHVGADPAPVPLAQRDWGGLRRAFRDLRQGELDHQGKLGSALRGMVLELVEVVHKALTDGQGIDADLEERSAQLRDALRGDNVESLRQAAQDVATSLEQSLERREALHESTVRSLGTRLRTVRDELKEATRAAEVDALTGLANRAALDRRLAASVTLGRFGGQHETMLMLDVDHFKRINDTHGHPVGDKVLAAVGACLAKSIIRRSDFVARYGGEEFAIILSDTEQGRAVIVGERLLDEIRALRIEGENGVPVRLTASLGIAELRPTDDVEHWLQAADRAMYAAKDAGRDGLCLRG